MEAYGDLYHPVRQNANVFLFSLQHCCMSCQSSASQYMRCGKETMKELWGG